MQNRRTAIGLLVIVAVLGVLGYRVWFRSTDSSIADVAAITGPAILLFRGDDSAGCRAIQRLVENAARRYQGRIRVIQTDWSTDNPLIARYQVRFLPTVIFIDAHGDEAGRMIGESPATQAQLARALEAAGPWMH